MERTIEELRYKQNLPLEIKVRMTKNRIREWVKEFGTEGVYVSFSGGKDSTVLLHIVREMYPTIPAVFIDTGLEYPEIRKFVTTFDNVEWVKPKMNFKQVIDKYGYPFISKELSGIIGGGQRSLEILKEEGYDITDRNVVIEECANRLKKSKGEWRRLAQCYGSITEDNVIKTDITEEEKGRYSSIPKKYEFMINAPFHISEKCCNVMKKAPAHEYGRITGRVPFTAQMTEESRLRTIAWLNNGCNAFDSRYKVSNPMAFWTEQDVLKYIKIYNIPMASVYGDLVYEDEYGNQYDEVIDDSGVRLTTTGLHRTGCMFCGYGCHLEKGKGRFELMKETHPKQYDYIMKPWGNGGLNYKAVIDWMNENGNLGIKY